ncbi:MAG TPA: RQC domain-containing protein, partial [Pseudomonadales bacterium]|nr:RQC domain-containing protein [Pseudomonadales bacterium]
RDGEPSTAWMVYGLEDVIKLNQMLESSQADPQFKRVERHKLDAMLGLCEITSCRRHALLLYFGEDSPETCGNCDACLNPAELWDGTLAAQKALSCVYRTGQRFGVYHMIEVLTGVESEKVRQHAHQTLSTFGIGKELNANQWRSVFRQLVARGYLTVDMSSFGSLLLTEKCRPLLRGECSISLRRDVKDKVVEKRPSFEKHAIRAEDRTLWDALRDCRKQLAAQFGVPPYVIFHDATLLEILRKRPRNTTQLLRISGIGESKAYRYGDEFLRVLSEFETSTDLSA